MDFHIPNLANGTFVPMEVQLREAKERELRKTQLYFSWLTSFPVFGEDVGHFKFFRISTSCFRIRP